MLTAKAWHERFGALAHLKAAQKVQAVVNELRTLTSKSNLGPLLDEFCESIRGKEKCVESYAHDNGFDKIILYADKHIRMKMRLHIWRPLKSPDARPRQNVHNHRWDFSSAVLAGYADNVLYRFAGSCDGNGERFFHYHYRAREEKEHYEVESLGTSVLVRESANRHFVGGLYSIDNKSLHRVDIPSDRLVATLVITHENGDWITNDLLSEREIGRTKITRVSSPAMDTSQVLARVGELRFHLGV